jgi:hypothetical protein
MVNESISAPARLKNWNRIVSCGPSSSASTRIAP